ncbi:MAG: carboxypeptidase-like regulatory domain-containing protein [Chitinophagaceae bacterium]
MLQTFVSAQQKTVNGSVKNAEDGSPLAAVTIQVKGTNIGTTTDPNGNFSIKASDNQTLVASAIGFCVH